MGKNKEMMQDWLTDYGYDLGFDNDSCPPTKDWNIIANNNVKVWEYYGKTHKQYYGGK
jgi:hypothetical protein